MTLRDAKTMTEKEFNASVINYPKKNDFTFTFKYVGVDYEIHYFRDINIENPEWSASYSEKKNPLARG